MQRDLPATHESLKQGHCVPCEGGTAPLTETEENNYHDAAPQWEIHRDGVHTITRTFECKDFKEAVSLLNKIADTAEQEQHHPNINLHDYKKVTVELFTHAINGLSTNDFIMAVKINELTP